MDRVHDIPDQDGVGIAACHPQLIYELHQDGRGGDLRSLCSYTTTIKSFARYRSSEGMSEGKTTSAGSAAFPGNVSVLTLLPR